jgi:hypothetical protein
VEELTQERDEYKAQAEYFERTNGIQGQLLNEALAREQQLRNVVTTFSNQTASNQCVDYHVCCGVAEDLSHSENCPAIKALSLPTDDTALRQYGAKVLRKYADDVLQGERKLLVSAVREMADELEKGK